MTTKDKAKLKKKLEEICKPYCTSDWCILKEMLLHTHDNLRTFIQLKMIELLKWNLSQRVNHEVDWEDASMKWVDSGMAKKFADYYDEEVDVNELYNKIEKECKPFD